MLEFKRGRLEKCDTCGKILPHRFYYWCNSYQQFCSYTCYSNSPLRKYVRGTHGGSFKTKLYRSLKTLLKYKLNPFYHLKQFDGFRSWGDIG